MGDDHRQDDELRRQQEGGRDEEDGRRGVRLARRHLHHEELADDGEPCEDGEGDPAPTLLDDSRQEGSGEDDRPYRDDDEVASGGR